MKERIAIELLRLEQKHGIKILYAVESGSRAWGFASTDSDWDVRFIYIHKQDWYLSIDDKKDSTEEMLPDDIDLAGWELRKALKLFRKSNPPLLEWLNSPIVYLENFSTANKLRDLAKEYFNPISCLHHYLHMAEGNIKEYLSGDKVRLKKYFYMLRPILACQWIERTNTMAPTEFEKLVNAEVNDPKLKSEIGRLLEQKMSGEEMDKGKRIKIIDDFLEERVIHFNKFLEQFKHPIKPDTKKLDDLFRQTLVETK
jgi:predicted nucleotidyltransferase